MSVMESPGVRRALADAKAAEMRAWIWFAASVSLLGVCAGLFVHSLVSTPEEPPPPWSNRAEFMAICASKETEGCRQATGFDVSQCAEVADALFPGQAGGAR